MVTKSGGKGGVTFDTLFSTYFFAFYFLDVELQHKATKWQLQECGQKAGVVTSTPTFFEHHRCNIALNFIGNKTKNVKMW